MDRSKVETEKKKNEAEKECSEFRGRRMKWSVHNSSNKKEEAWEGEGRFHPLEGGKFW